MTMYKFNQADEKTAISPKGLQTPSSKYTQHKT